MENEKMLHVMIIYYFFSLSIPDSSLIVAFHEISRAKSVEIRGVLNGIDDDGYEFFRKNATNIVGKAMIDPREFTKYNIKSVPAYVLVIGDKSYTVTGDISPGEALKIFYKHTKKPEIQNAIKEIKNEQRNTR